MCAAGTRPTFCGQASYHISEVSAVDIIAEATGVALCLLTHVALSPTGVAPNAVKELLGDHTADKARHQAAEDRASEHAAAHPAKRPLQHPRLAQLGAGSQPRQGLWVVLAECRGCLFIRGQPGGQLAQHLRPLGRRQPGKGLRVRLLDRFGWCSPEHVAVALQRLFVSVWLWLHVERAAFGHWLLSLRRFSAPE